MKPNDVEVTRESQTWLMFSPAVSETGKPAADVSHLGGARAVFVAGICIAEVVVGKNTGFSQIPDVVALRQTRRDGQIRFF